MANNSLSDHIVVFADVLSAERCRTLIDRFESSPHHESAQRESGHSFIQLDITQNWPDENKILRDLFLAYFNQYQLALNAAFWPPRFSPRRLLPKPFRPMSRPQ